MNEFIKLLKQLGYTVLLSPEMEKAIYTSKEIYKGYIDGFHKYKEYNGVNIVDKTRKSLGMPIAH